MWCTWCVPGERYRKMIDATNAQAENTTGLSRHPLRRQQPPKPATGLGVCLEPIDRRNELLNVARFVVAISQRLIDPADGLSAAFTQLQ